MEVNDGSWVFFGETICGAPPNSLKELSASSKMKAMEEEGVGVCSLIRSTLKVKRAC